MDAVFHVVINEAYAEQPTTKIVEITDEEAEEIRMKNEEPKIVVREELTTKLADIIRKKYEPNSLEDCIAGLVYGCAIGDCLGIPYKGKLSSNIQYNKQYSSTLEYSTQGFNGHDPYTWSDDTDQVIIALHVLKSTFDSEEFINYIKEWKNNGFSSLDNKRPNCSYLMAGVLANPQYTVDPYKSAVSFYKKVGFIAPNCALTRSAVFGIFPDWKSTSVNQCLLTHSDPRCVYASYQMAKITRAILRKQFDISIDDLFADHKDFIPMTWRNEMLSYIKKYNNNNLPELDLDNPIVTEQQYVFRSLGCVLYAYNALKTNSKMEDILLQVLQAGGDTDTNCALVGLIFGAAGGYMQLNRALMLGLANYLWLEKAVINFMKCL